MAEFKDMLKYFREREHLSQKQLAEKLGISSSTISMYEVGSRQPNFEMEEAIADFFNVDLNTLRGKVANENNSNDPEVQKAIELYNRYKNLTPANQAAFLTLLDSLQSDS